MFWNDSWLGIYYLFGYSSLQTPNVLRLRLRCPSHRALLARAFKYFYSQRIKRYLFTNGSLILVDINKFRACALVVRMDYFFLVINKNLVWFYLVINNLWDCFYTPTLKRWTKIIIFLYESLRRVVVNISKGHVGLTNQTRDVVPINQSKCKINDNLETVL